MRSPVRALVLPIVALFLFAPMAAAAPSADATRVIVVLRDTAGAPSEAAGALGRQYDFTPSQVYSHALKGFAAEVQAGRLNALRADPRVAFVSVDGEVHAVDQTLPTGINRIEGDLSSQLSGSNPSGSVNSVSGPAVAVIDTGSGPHLDLNIAGGKNCSDGKRFNDGNGHGTHVAGTIGALDNGIGVVGVAPGVPIYSVRVLNNAGFGTWSSVICGIDWVTANVATIKVANMSLGGSGSDDGNCGNTNNDALHKAICGSVKAGVTYVVAAGNSNVDLQGFVPAAYNEVLTVTAMADFNGRPGGGAAATCRADGDDTAADFSNWTTIRNIDAGHTIAAPGVCILSTWKGGGYNTISGTSMASPHVAGTAALCIATGIVTGKCTGDPISVINTLRADAAAQPAPYRFTNDPSTPNGSRYYGYLVYARGY